MKACPAVELGILAGFAGFETATTLSSCDSQLLLTLLSYLFVVPAFKGTMVIG